jgi:hypothetical protein
MTRLDAAKLKIARLEAELRKLRARLKAHERRAEVKRRVRSAEGPDE